MRRRGYWCYLLRRLLLHRGMEWGSVDGGCRSDSLVGI
jgi:hypothetical protein